MKKKKNTSSWLRKQEKKLMKAFHKDARKFINPAMDNYNNTIYFCIYKLSYKKIIMDKCKSYFGDYKCHVPTNLKDSKDRIVYVDKCLKETIESLNKVGLKTIASCCGHGIINPSIIIEKLTK